MKQREAWKSNLGFVLAALGSAVGLGSIWRFPYVVGENGGAAFILVYVFCLFLIGFPIMITEILIGRTAQSSPPGAFKKIAKSAKWRYGGLLTVLTGFIISSFYSVISGWALGYLIEAIDGSLTNLTTPAMATEIFISLSGSASWALGYHLGFLILSLVVLFSGVRKGIEAASKILMPLLFILLLFLTIKGLMMPGASEALHFIFSPNWSSLTAKGILMALGQAFFTLSLGQGTMITYGSYLKGKTDLVTTCFPIVILNTIIALLMGVSIFSIVFSVGMPLNVGEPLVFETLPIVFNQIPWGHFFSVIFFFLVFIAALTSEISALEPVIAYLIDNKKFSRHGAAITTVVGAFILGIPSALSFGLMKQLTIMGMNFLELVSFIAVNILVPIGALVAVLMTAWRWGMDKAFIQLKVHENHYFHTKPFLRNYFVFTVKYFAPLFIIFILLNSLGLF